MLWQLPNWVPLSKRRGEWGTCWWCVYENRKIGSLIGVCVCPFMQAEWIVWVSLWWHHHWRLWGLHRWNCRMVWAAEGTTQPLQNHSEGTSERLSPWLLHWCELVGLLLDTGLLLCTWAAGGWTLAPSAGGAQRMLVPSAYGSLLYLASGEFDPRVWPRRMLFWGLGWNVDFIRSFVKDSLPPLCFFLKT